MWNTEGFSEPVSVQVCVHKPVPSLPLQANILSDACLVRKNHLKAGVWHCRTHPARFIKGKKNPKAHFEIKILILADS